MKVKLLVVTLIACLTIACSNSGAIDESEQGIGENLTEPPNLTIAIGEKTLPTVIGSYSWTYYDEITEENVAIEQDAASPPELVNKTDETVVHSDAEVGLLFDYPPSDYTVNVWDSGLMIDTSDIVELSAYQGDVIYEIVANWEQGTVSYAFVLHIE